MNSQLERTGALERLLGRMENLPGGLALFIAIAFLVVRGAHLAWAWNWPLGGDAIGYDALGWLSAQGHSWVNTSTQNWQYGPLGTPTAVRTPGLPLFLAAIYAVLGHQPNAARVALILVNAIAAGMLFDVSKKHWGRDSALVVSLLWLFWPVSVRALYYLDALLGESLAIPLTIGTMWLIDRGRASAVVAGLVLGASILTRPHLGLVPVVLMVLAALFAVRRRKETRPLVLCVVACALLMTPWTVRNYLAFKSFIPLSSQSGLGLWAGWVRGGTGSWNDTPQETAMVTDLASEHPEILTASEPVKSRTYIEAALEEIAARGWVGTARHAAVKAWSFVSPFEYLYGFHSALLLATLLALFGLRDAMRTLTGQVAFSILAALFISAIVTFYLGRYRFIGTPALLFIAGAGIRRVVEHRRRAVSS